MPMSDADKAELRTVFADALVEGLGKFRSLAEEEEAKAQQQHEKDTKDSGGKDDSDGGKSGLDFAGFLLGRQ
jgi:VIT1/CCC1 family predicted Fe2+/Mn2+ transporter